MKKLLLILLGIGCIAGAGIAAYFFYFAPEPSAKRLADTTMKSVTLGQTDALRNNSSANNVDQFVNASSQRNFKHLETAYDADTYYFSYIFADDRSPKKARIGIKEGAVAHLATGNALGARPKDDKQEEIANQETQDHCLSRDDLQYLDAARLYARHIRAVTMIFAPNESLSYSGKENGTLLLTRVANFYKKSHTKDYQFVLRGYAPNPETYSEQYEKQVSLSNNRAAKMYDDLIKLGVSRDRITIGEPSIYDQPPPYVQDNYVNIYIINNCL